MMKPFNFINRKINNNACSVLLSLIAASFLAGCSDVPSANHDPMVIAHQGGVGQWPSNTLFAFQQSKQLGTVDEFELDIQLSSDGHIVLIHDKTVDRTTNGQGLVSGMTLTQLQKLDAGYTWQDESQPQAFPFRKKGITIPTLKEIFEHFPQQAMSIEIKQESTELAVAFCKMVKQYQKEEALVVSSFYHENLLAFREACPSVATAASGQEAERYIIASKVGLGWLFKPNAQVLQLPMASGSITVLTAGFINQAHEHGYRVDAWTINEKADMTSLMDLGIDGLITDYPSRLLNTLTQQHQAAKL